MVLVDCRVLLMAKLRYHAGGAGVLSPARRPVVQSTDFRVVLSSEYNIGTGNVRLVASQNSAIAQSVGFESQDDNLVSHLRVRTLESQGTG